MLLFVYLGNSEYNAIMSQTHLMRTPTPYPKEMKERMQQIRQLAIYRANGPRNAELTKPNIVSNVRFYSSIE